MSKKSAVETPAQTLLKAVNFIMPTQKKRGTPNQQFCYIGNGWIVSCDEHMAIGYPTPTPIEAYPNTHQLRAALLKCGEDLSITVINQFQISLLSGSYKAVIACNPAIGLKSPDPIVGPVDDRLKQAFKAVHGMAVVNANRPELGAVQLKGGLCNGLDPKGTACLQAWHGFEIPGEYLVPKPACVALAKAKEALTGFGFSESSVTFHFENGAFIKTALHLGNFPNVEAVFNEERGEPYLIPDNFFKAVKAIEPFSDKGFLYFRKGRITSNSEESEASTYKMENLPEDKVIAIGLYLKVKACFQNVQFNERSAHFQQDNVRGVIALVGNPDA